MKNLIIYINRIYIRISDDLKRSSLSYLLFFALIMSCNETEFLEEVPLDFYSPENSYVSPEQFDAAIIGLHKDYRDNFWGSANVNQSPQMMFSGTDMIMNDKDMGENPPDYVSVLLPTSNRVKYVWVEAYGIIYNANVIIARADAENSQLSEAQSNLVKGEAMFFRALGYNMLANLYGGVPIVLEETSSPKRDYVRATRTQVYEQCALDLEFAATNLPDISSVEDHRVSKETANHLLSQVYVSLERWTDAIDAATKVIDHYATGLMTSRFGTRVNDTNFGGDVYWDLFRQGNQNRSTGNTEALWVLQFEHQVTGGGNLLLERMSVPRLWRTDIEDTDGESRSLIAGGEPNTNYYGRGSGFLRPTSYFYNELWDNDGGTDIRNSEFNIVRDFKVNNPDSPSHGLYAVANNLIPLNTYTDSARNFFPVVAKLSTPGLHPSDLWTADQKVTGALTSDARRTYRDHYSMRLAETYLLRAEAHLGNNNPGLAADDINEVRRRSNAPEVSDGEVNIDYILDERLRELNYEEFRLLTLTRLGKLVQRTKAYNPIFVGNSMQDHHNLYPIPFSEIEANTEAVLTQNLGYFE